MTSTTANRRIKCGFIVATPGALAELDSRDLSDALSRHLSGDWGECCEEDRQSNEEALENGNRLFSVYRDRNGTKFWIITEADRSSTTVLLPDEY